MNVLVMTGGAKSWKTEPEYLEGAESVSANQEDQLGSAPAGTLKTR